MSHDRSFYEYVDNRNGVYDTSNETAQYNYETTRTKNRFAYEAPFNMKMYHDGPSMSYSEGVGFPEALENVEEFYNVNNLGNVEAPLHILDNGSLQCKTPTFNENVGGYNPQEAMKIKCCNSINTCTFNKCKQPDHRFGMAESVYKLDPENYKDQQRHNSWHNLSSKEFIENGDYKYITKQQWTNVPWSLERYAAPKLCPNDHYEEWRTDEDRCHSDYKICHNLFNNMTRRKSIL